jgi:hypothetical protein
MTLASFVGRVRLDVEDKFGQQMCDDDGDGDGDGVDETERIWRSPKSLAGLVNPAAAVRAMDNESCRISWLLCIELIFSEQFLKISR